jgi:putative heme-binding domain-containing protein
VRLSEPRLDAWPEGLAKVCELANADDGQLLMQTAYSLGATSEEQAAAALARLAWTHRDDPYLATAALSSVGETHLSTVCGTVVAQAQQDELPEALFQPLMKQAIAAENSEALALLLTSFSRPDLEALAPWQWSAAVDLLSALRRAAPQLRDDPALAPPLAALDALARRAALDAPTDEQSQAAAVQLLSLTGSADEVVPVLAELLMPQRPPTVQLAVLSALRSVDDDQAATLVLEAWPGLTGPARSEAFDLLLGRRALVKRLLEALDAGQVGPTDLDAMQRQRLLTLDDDALALQARETLAGAVDANRAQLVADYLAAPVEEGAASRGRGLFEKHCASCHALSGVGYAVGPDLSAITNRSRPAWTESILDPNRAVDERYRTYTALTSEGLARAGILRGETSTSVTLVEQRAAVYTLLRSDLELFENSGRSLMPEGLEQDLSPQDVVDVIAYVNQQRRTPKQIPGNQPQVVIPDYDGTLWLRAADAEIYGQQITFETPHQNIGYWHGVEDHVAWNLDTTQLADYEAFVHWACPESSAHNVAVLEAGGKFHEWAVGATDGYDDYRVQSLGRILLPAGSQQVVVRPKTSLNG